MSFPVYYWRYVSKGIQYACLLFILLGIVINPWTLAKILHKTTFFSSTTVHIMLTLEFMMIGIFFLLFIFIHKYSHQFSDNTKEQIFLLLFSVLFIFLSLLCVEGFIRLFFAQHTLSRISSTNPQIYEVGENISWQLKPYSIDNMTTGEFNVEYRINSLGMRDKEYNVTKDNHSQRILLLGDSFTVGFSVPYNQTWPTLLEEALNKNQQTSVEILNSAVSAYSPDTEYVYLKNAISTYKPDVVLLGFYVGNDITDLSHNEWTATQNGLPTHITSKIYLVQDDSLILNPTASVAPSLYQYVSLLFSRFSQTYILFNKMMYGTTNRNLEPVYCYLKSLDTSIEENFQASWNTTFTLLEAMSVISKENNAEFIIVLIPPRMQVNEKEWNSIEKQYSYQLPERTFPQQRILDWCDSHDIQCIDLYPSLLQDSQQGELLYNDLWDTHLNVLGNQRVAEILEQQNILT
jgi:hypothetical protein